MKSIFTLVILALLISACQTPTKRDIAGIVDDSTPVSNAAQIALVIGNSDYEYRHLANPVNDANDVASRLHKMGFDVTLKTDLNQVDMIRAIHAFAIRLSARPGVGLFYFAGHGAQVDGKNYLLPIDNNKIVDHTSLKSYAVDVDGILKRMLKVKNHLNIIILDACRNDPYQGSTQERGRGQARGLARMQSPRGSIIAFATAPGKAASDTSVGEDNGRFTKYLLKGLDKAHKNHQRIDDMLMEVSNGVIQESGGDQEPWYSASLRAPFCFGGGCLTAQLPTPPSSTSYSSPSLESVPVPPPPELLTLASMPPKTVFRDTLRDGGKGPEMVFIPAGRFRMGDLQGGGYDDEKPVHWVSVEKFAIGRYEILL
ncbi:MAG TPA: hypothetical protein ENI48_06205 [Thioploca sp.]|nr:hypothetical protein [Thioploca sp.]